MPLPGGPATTPRRGYGLELAELEATGELPATVEARFAALAACASSG